MKKVYHRLFKRCGLNVLLVEASGGTFSKYSHEFQVLSEAGEDMIYYCRCGWAQNKEIFGGGTKCPKCGEKLQVSRAIEVGNIFKLGAKYSQPFNLTFRGKNGKEQTVIMGCYGIGLGRIMGAVAEISHDKKGIIWPESVAPFKVHLLCVKHQVSSVKKLADKIYNSLQKAGVGVLYDDREDVSAGEKFADADLMGIPYRLVIGEKTGGKIEIKKRNEKKAKLINFNELIKI